MTLIDTTYFSTDKNGIYIPATDINNPQNMTDVTELISVMGKEYLISVLGYQLYKEFETAIDGTPSLKWTELRDGKTYVKDGVTYRWNGFVNDDKDSAIAYYTYFYWLRKENRKLSLTGGVENKNENSETVTMFNKSVSAYNKMVNLTCGTCSTLVGLYEFLRDINEVDEDTYPNWIGKKYSKILPTFGI